MLIHVGIENNVEGRSLAWALDYPGCFAYGRDENEALAALPDAIFDHLAWVGSRSSEGDLLQTELGHLELDLEDSWNVYIIDEHYEFAAEGYEVNAWFRRDWKPLTMQEIQEGLQILAWSREDLLAMVQGLTPEQMAYRFPGERWDITGILRHIGGAEWWYLNRLGLAFPQDELPKQAFERLAKTRAHLEQTLPGLAGVLQVLGVDGEFWSPRKLLRRAAWHEKDHIQHILSLRMRFETSS